MRLRYRKSINLGGGFRINLSKSGVGYSWGVKGYRVTKTAGGKVRTTTSIPGTGISFVEETGSNSRRRKQNTFHNYPPSIPSVNDNYYDTKNIENSSADGMVSEGLEDMLASASKALRWDKLASSGVVACVALGISMPVLFLAAIGFLILKVYVRIKGVIKLEYDIDEDQQALVSERTDPIRQLIDCRKVWRIMTTKKVINRKYEAGANTAVNRISCTTATKVPFPFKTNLQVPSFSSRGETLLFFPDKVFIMQGSKIGALNYSDITSNVSVTRFIESEHIPNDAQVVGHTWRYVNQSGGPDRRFKNNRQLPICLYGKLELASSSGMNTIIMFSDVDLFSALERWSRNAAK